MDFPLSAVLADGTELNANAKLFNKRNSLSPKFLGVSPGSYLILLDPQRQSIRKLRLSDLVWYDYLTTPRLNTLQNLEFNSTWEFIYSSFKSQADDTLFALRVSQASPGFYYPGCLPGSVANIVYDNTNKRTLVVLARQEQDGRRFKVLSFAADQNTGFVDAQQSFSDPPCIPAPQNVVWDIPAEVIQGTFKDFNYHRLGKSFVVADERIVNGAATTAIQVFSDNGDKRFEVQLGADVSNMAINNTEGVIYVAEQHSSAAGKIKAIDINTGLVTDLVQSISGYSPGSYTQLRVDNPNKKLYIADDVSDAFFVVDLTTNNMSELIYQAASIR
ncbi:MAG: hypothetical protein EOO68_08695 [Moraxellaceae bacterium]|nr:MAG: hypothetical protein EOO68_08695 [Moraxellaceae bacterium]